MYLLPFCCFLGVCGSLFLFCFLLLRIDELLSGVIRFFFITYLLQVLPCGYHEALCVRAHSPPNYFVLISVYISFSLVYPLTNYCSYIFVTLLNLHASFISDFFTTFKTLDYSESYHIFTSELYTLFTFSSYYHPFY